MLRASGAPEELGGVGGGVCASSTGNQSRVSEAPDTLGVEVEVGVGVGTGRTTRRHRCHGCQPRQEPDKDAATKDLIAGDCRSV